MKWLESRTHKQRWPNPSDARRDTLEGDLVVTVIGGGIAGLSAATILAERGARVTVVEAEEELGGRVRSWKDTLADGTEFEMERGFHAFFRQYHNLRGLMRRVDPELSRLVPLLDYPVLGAEGALATFSDLPTLPPLNLVEVVKRSPLLDLRALMGVNVREALEMLRFETQRTYSRYDEVSAREYLDGLNFPPEARALLFDVFAHSFFNPEETMSAGELLMMFHFYFLGNSEGLVFDVLDAPFGRALWDPYRTYLESLGVEFQMGTAACRVDSNAGRWQVHTTADHPLDCDAVVMAVAVPGLQSIVGQSPDLSSQTWRTQVEQLDTTLSFAVWRLWLDIPSAPGRAPFAGTADAGLLDNISLYHLFQDESRAWAEVHGGSVVELHAYAVPDDAGEEQVKTELLSGLHTLYPEYRGANTIEERYLSRRDCPSFDVGSYADRPPVASPFGGIRITGDFVRLPFPSALMERAASSGIMAANQLLEARGVRGETLWSVVPQGLLSRRR